MTHLIWHTNAETQVARPSLDSTRSHKIMRGKPFTFLYELSYQKEATAEQESSRVNKRIPMTTYDGTGNQPGWERFPDSEVAVPPGYKLLSAWRKGNELRIHVEPLVRLERCTICGARMKVHDHDEPEAQDWNHGKYAARIIFHRAKRECLGSTKHSRSDLLPGLDLTRHMMSRLRDSLRKHANRTNIDNAEQFKVSDKTVAAVIREEAAKIGERHRTTDVFEILVFDEKPNRGKLHFVVSAPDTTTTILVLPTNDAESIRKELFNFQNRHFVRFIVTDGTNNYDAIIAELYPQAVHIRDLRHFLNDLSDCREEVRRSDWRVALGAEKKALFGRKNFWRDLETEREIDKNGQLFLFQRPDSTVQKANRVHRDFFECVYLAQNATQAASLFWYWAENIPEEIKPFYQAYIERFEKAPDEFFHYWSSGLTSSPGESANSKIAAEIRKGKHLSDEGLAARIVVVDDRKRSKALGSDEISESDVERQAELSTDNSAARSERMAERYRNRKAKVPAADALHGENRKAPSTESDAPIKEPALPDLESISQVSEDGADQSTPRHCRSPWRRPSGVRRFRF